MPVLGVSSIYMYPKNVINAIKEAAIMGFRHINIFAYPPHFKEDSDEFVNNVKRVIFEYGMDCSIKIQGYTINPVATNPNLRKKSIEEINYWIDVASKIDCPAVIMRAGMFFYAERVFREKTYQRLIDTLREIINRIESLGMDMYIENYPYPFDIVVLPSDFARLYRSLKSRVYLALNLPHLYDVYRNRKVDVFSELQMNLPWIRIVYISEYINPWDYPHRLDTRRFNAYVDFLKKTTNILKRGELGAIVVIGYSKEDVLSAKELVMRRLFG